MGKRRKTIGDKKRHQFDLVGGRDNGRKPESSLLDPSSRGFVYDEVDDYEDQRDLLHLSRAQTLMARHKTEKEQVLGIDVSSSEDDGEDYDDDDDDDDDEEEEEEERKEAANEEAEGSDEDALYMEDDIEDQEERLPDERAWGSKKWRYIGTNTTDERIERMAHGEDEETARLEEETARKLQERMAAELENLVTEDLLPQDISKKGEAELASSITVDLSTMSRTKKLQLLRRESPEFMPLVEDLKEKLNELRSYLGLLMAGVKEGHITDKAVREYLTTKYRLTLNYVCVLSVYMMTKCNAGVVSQHPVVARLAQYRQLLQELVPCDEKLKPHLEEMLPKIKAAIETNVKKPSVKPRQLQLLVGRRNRAQDKKRKLSDLLEDGKEQDNNKQRGKKEKQMQYNEAAEVSSDEDNLKDVQDNEEDKGEEDILDPEGKRAITYQIAKNKGLIPSRKKEQRNPRVKYRRKYQTKLKRRKGQVRVVRKEVKKYEGEVSGIKAHTVKSVKIK